MNQQPIYEVHLHKHLGFTFSSDCKWHGHIIELKTKAWHRIYGGTSKDRYVGNLNLLLTKNLWKRCTFLLLDLF